MLAWIWPNITLTAYQHFRGSQINMLYHVLCVVGDVFIRLFLSRKINFLDSSLVACTGENLSFMPLQTKASYRSCFLLCKAVKLSRAGKRHVNCAEMRRASILKIHNSDTICAVYLKAEQIDLVWRKFTSWKWSLKLTKRDELSFFTVLALPKDSRMGLACRSWRSNSPYGKRHRYKQPSGCQILLMHSVMS